MKRRATLLVAWALQALSVPAAPGADTYVSWEGSEADKGAALWYLRRHVAPQALIELLPYGAPLDRGTTFDVPQARYKRTHNSTAFEALLRDYPSADPTIQTMASVIHDIEINAWGAKESLKN